MKTPAIHANQSHAPCSLSEQLSNPLARVEVHSGLEQVTPKWRELERIGTAPPYQRLAWFTTWVRTAGAERGEAPLIIAAYDDEDRVTLLLPLVVRSRLGLKVAFFPGGKHANFNMPLLRPGLSLCDAQVEWLLSEVSRLQPDLDLLLLEAMPPAWESVNNPLIGSSARPHSASGSLLSSSAQGDFDASARRRKERWRDRQMLQHGAVTVHRATSITETSQALAAFAAQKAGWCKTRGIEDPFRAPGVLAFFNALAVEPTSGFELYCLTVGDTEAAVAGVLLGRTRASLMFVSYDAGSPVAAYSPGIRLIQEVIADTRQRGFAEFDFGLGEGGYKARFGAQLELSAVLIRPLTPRGRLGALLVEGKRLTKIVVKRQPWLAGLVHQLGSWKRAAPL
ncbi:MAG: GNAT family N-acetyltransferase [Methylorubrum rhodinum]|uniref:GNAT family N-acetyltransferase n=1 Tax=Methylorubrum rhodinum TaxID=29428 RepID=UPI003BAFFF7C